MPKDNIERLLKRGAAKDAMALSEITYEAHGPGGVALIIETKTDNKNRTVAQIRHVLKEGGGMLVHFCSSIELGTLETSGSVQWCFKTMGLIDVFIVNAREAIMLLRFLNLTKLMEIS